MCQLLLEYGVKPEHTHGGSTPLNSALRYGSYTSFTDVIDTLRYVFNDKTMIEDFNRWQWQNHVGEVWDANMAQWFWRQSQHVLSGGDRTQLQCYIFRRTWYSFALCLCVGIEWKSFAQEIPEFAMDTEFLKELERGRCKLLQAVFEECHAASRSYVIGDELVKWLDRSGVDVNTCISNELVDMFEGIVDILYGKGRVVFEPRGNQGWTLGFEWVFDPEETGYLIASEYPALGDENRYGISWSFHDRGYQYPWYQDEESGRRDHQRNERFKRRMATKARKKYAQEWRNLPQSKMPGEWIWGTE
jgi:hypothetical protein